MAPLDFDADACAKRRRPEDVKALDRALLVKIMRMVIVRSFVRPGGRQMVGGASVSTAIDDLRVEWLWGRIF